MWELDLKINCYFTYNNHPIWKPGEFGKITNLDNVVGFHNMMQELELVGFHKRNENCPTLVNNKLMLNIKA